MDSPLATTLANLYLGKWVSEYSSIKRFVNKRYVDGIFAIFRNELKVMSFLTYLNNKHPNIKFTIEMEKEKKVPFLNIYYVFSKVFTN